MKFEHIIYIRNCLILEGYKDELDSSKNLPIDSSWNLEGMQEAKLEIVSLMPH